METSDACDVCGLTKPITGLNLFGQRGATRISLCKDCGKKARAHDAETWEKIRAITAER